MVVVEKHDTTRTSQTRMGRSPEMPHMLLSEECTKKQAMVCTFSVAVAGSCTATASAARYVPTQL